MSSTPTSPIAFRVLPIVLALSLGACVNLAPDYAQPVAPVSPVWSHAVLVDDGQKSALQDMASSVEWQQFFLDKRLQEVLALALENNRDLRIAALNIQKARAQYQLEDAERYPALTSNVGSTVARKGSPTIAREHNVNVGISSYELDFFGRLQNLSTAALETYQYNIETRRSTQISLVAEVANAWLTLAADNERLALTRATLKNQQRSYALIKGSHAIGVRSGLDLAEAHTSVEAALAAEWAYINLVAQDASRLNLLVGASVSATLLPDTIPDSATMLLSSPAELPSNLLLRRPDVLAAEHTLIAANANIGAARAAFFPSISLTAQGGTISSSLSGLFAAGSGSWLFMPAITLPIFNAGSNKASLAVAEIMRDIDVANYEKTIQAAFKDVDDALTERGTLLGRLAAQQRLTDASTKSYQLSDARYRNGIDSYLNTLVSQRSLYSAQLDLIALRLIEQVNRVTLYRAMGGGWQ
ncbi:efflux transporter outer membrane subunit [Glaciimonas immobilis]|uniref:NodT family efflux transporter outer membrane factor (OMF) lipoprotein n=1 Tax=Glaciimonas immobilis TaxID=728004 RepID=A0A840RUG9_9BURK|nr:efflux transporter outer membrane subunit [Glaciimonas immobilis]KAF3996397.1 efflux transporter outer membrane subunit [Glaciimonas immobilis]MBB5201273.1 NodT family efflux transporter outer membrane factor (OMF) lipoprotein [Glaciimonas immobilis]